MDSYPPTVGIHHVAIQTNDLDQALTFYIDFIGLLLIERKKFKDRELAWLKAGNTKIEIYTKRRGDKLAEWNDYFPGPVQIAFEVPDLEDFLNRARQMGIRFHPSHPEPFYPPVINPQKIAYFLGPDGEEIQVRGVTL